MNPSKRPNILFLMADQCQAAVLDRGNPCRTPNLDRLAARGVKFSRAYTPNAICSPARASLMTGLLPHNHGMLMVTHNNDPDLMRLRVDKPHWAQELVAAGYRTGYFGKWHVEHSENPSAFGWQDAHPMDEKAFPPQKAAASQSGLPGYSLEHEGYDPVDLYRVFDRDPEKTVAAGICASAHRFLDQNLGGEAPWCCFVSLLEPHDPFYCGKSAYESYSDVTIDLPPSDNLADRPGIYRRVARIFSSMTPDQHRQAAKCYYASVTEIDALYGKIMDRLEAAGELENTVIVFTSDHGELLGAHGLYCKNFSAFEQIYRIPLIMAGPGVGRAGDLSPARVGLQDVGPTLLDLAGLPALPNADGVTFRAALRDAASDGFFRTGFAEYFGSRIFLTQRTYWEGDWKYVFNGFDEDEMYNLKDDPDELRNLASDPAFTKEAKRLLSDMWQCVTKSGDKSLARSNYPPYRIALVGPNGEGSE